MAAASETLTPTGVATPSASTTLYWRARAVTPGGSTSSWTATASFLIDHAPNTPTLTGPTGTTTNLVATLQWTFTDPDTGDSQSGWGVRTAINAGAYQYWNAVTGVWQATDILNTGANTSLTVTLAPGAWAWSAKVYDQAGLGSAYATDNTFIIAGAITPPPPPPPVTAAPVLNLAGVTTNWVNSLLTGGQMVVVCDILSGGQPVTGLTNIGIETATVTADRNSAQRTRFTATLNPVGIIPTGLTSALAPNGNELRLKMGWLYPTGVTEMMQLGVFPIATVKVSDTGANLTLNVTGYDRSWTVSVRGFQAPYSVGTGVTVDDAIAALIASRAATMPPFTYNITPTAAIAPAASWNEGSDPWAAAQADLADAAGYELYYDRSGNLVGKPVLDPTTLPVVWTYDDSELNPGIKQLDRTLTAEGVNNDFVVSGTGATTVPPVRGRAFNANTTSPTAVTSAFGDRPSFVSDNLVTTTTQATAEAQKDLLASLGKVDTIVLTVVPNAALDIDHIVKVTRARAGVTAGLYVVDGWSITTHFAGAMTINLRAVYPQ